MKVLIDINVIMDVFAQRAPFYTAAARVWALAESKQIDASVSAISFSTVYYLSRRLVDRSFALAALQKMTSVFSIAPVDGGVIRSAIGSGMPDIEDAIQFYSAKAIGASYIVTRDPAGFAKSSIMVVSPDELTRLAIP